MDDNTKTKGTPGRLSLWFQRRMNVKTVQKIRRKGGRMMGMDVMILHTVGRKSGQPRQTPLAWFADGDARLVVASGGGSGHPDWYLNLAEHPDSTAIELAGHEPVPVTPHRLDGADRDRAWQLVTAALPRLAKYQAKSEREYPVVRLTPA